MEPVYLGIVSGIVLGLSSSLHCAGMCSGIATSILFSFDVKEARDRFHAVLLAHLGRAIAYTTIGALLGAAGAGVLGTLPPVLAYRMLQWSAAVAMMWIGLSTAGLMPSISVADRILAPISHSVGRNALRLRQCNLGPVGMGLAWGLMPCPMVVGAYLTAMLTGSAYGGVSVMFGFALATMPALAASSLGLRALAASRDARLRTVVGLIIAAVGFSGYLLPVVAQAICR